MTEDELTRLFHQAIEEPAYRPVFLEHLLKSRVYVLGHAGTERRTGEVELDQDDRVWIKNWQRKDGQVAVPFFLSRASLEFAAPGEDEYMRIPATVFFHTTLGQMLVLEPNTGHTKEFTPGEVERLLDGGPGMKPRLNEDSVGVSLYLEPPDPYPHEMVRSLSLLLDELAAVERAYVVRVVPAGEEGEARLLIAVDCNHDRGRVIRYMGAVAHDTAPDGIEVELIFLDGEGELSREIVAGFEPFFQRAPGA